MTWVCASCAAKHDTNDPPCKRCGHGVFAKIEGTETPDEIEERTQVVYRCTSCGEDHFKNNPPCDQCGNMQLEPTYNPSVDEGAVSDGLAVASEPKSDYRVTAKAVTLYLTALVLVFLAIGYFSNYPTAAFFFLLTAVVVAPSARRRLAVRGIQFSSGGVALLSIVLFSIGFYFLVS